LVLRSGLRKVGVYDYTVTERLSVITVRFSCAASAEIDIVCRKLAGVHGETGETV
jgi:hypothetical protein